MDNERQKQGIPKRQARKESLVHIGKVQFGFCKERELRRYKYLCHEKFSKEEWEKCKVCEQHINMPYSYYDWSEGIKQKYNTYDIMQLVEFDKYLELCIRKKMVSRETINILNAALASCGLAVVFNNIVVDYAADIGLITSAAASILMVIAIIFIVAVIVYSVSSPIWSNSLEYNMYKDYQSVIKEIIESKKKKLEES